MMEEKRMPPEAAIFGTANGVFFMAIFGTLWAYTGIMGLQWPGGTQTALLIIALLIGIALCITGFLLLRSGRKFSGTSAGSKSGKKQRNAFNLIFAAEGIAIAIAIFVCNATQITQLIPIIVALIVGVHFFPLASLFGVRVYHLTGGLICAIALVAWIFIPERISIGGYETNAYMTVVGLGSALVLWLTSLQIVRIGRGIVQNAETR
ncbi:hypothetical protein [Planococcus plakortidis]|uniref:hypothetical protein n=1 Tax=Planococcus plakortidis TaxID=1038856 RepID=UPI003984B82D